jgi:hypothetical protein
MVTLLYIFNRFYLYELKICPTITKVNLSHIFNINLFYHFKTCKYQQLLQL